MSSNLFSLKQHEKFVITIFINLEQLQHLINLFSNTEALVNTNDFINFRNEGYNLYNYVESYLNKDNTLEFYYYYNNNYNNNFGFYLNEESNKIYEVAKLLYSNRFKSLNGINTLESWYIFLRSIVIKRINNLKTTLKETIIKN